MTFVSLADACRRLNIDAKTLHRWLADAQIAKLTHPHDGRKKGVSEEHLELLAREHHRHLACGEPPAIAQQISPIPALPTDLLKLPEQMLAMQAQFVTLQQQVADLTRLLTQHSKPPAIPAAPTKPKPVTKPRAKPASPATAKTPPKSVHVIPRVEYGEEGHYVVICPKRGLLPFEPDTPEWFAWVAKQSSFRFVGRMGHFSAHHEWRTPNGAWRAHRKIRNRTSIVRLAPNQQLTIAVLEQAATTLQARLA